MVELNLDERVATTGAPRINWGLVVTIIIAILGWAFAGLGDYRRIGDRVTTLEAQRDGDTKRLERLEDKIDRIWERVK